MSKLTTPVVNLNGNRKSTLVQEAMDIKDKLNAAYIAILESDISHGRNQPISSTHYTQARRERDEHAQWLHNRMMEYQQLAIDIDKQGV